MHCTARVRLPERRGLEAPAAVSTRAHVHSPIAERVRNHPLDVVAETVSAVNDTVKLLLQL